MANNQIAWEVLSEELVQGELESLPLEKLGLELQRLYYHAVIEGEELGEPQGQEELLSLVTSAVEAASETEAEWLSGMYKEGRLPRASHAADVATLFLSKIGRRFRRALCLELRESRTVALSTRETLVVLAPTIVAIMELPAEYAALAVPLSIVLTKITLSAFCEGVEDHFDREEFIEERVRLARKAVLYLQQEMTRYQEGVPPLVLQESLQQAEQRLSQLEERLGLGGEQKQIKS